jgi:hypothetical protein
LPMLSDLLLRISLAHVTHFFAEGFLIYSKKVLESLCSE